jgi:predicted nucleic acid-binding Zn ribbon protein
VIAGQLRQLANGLLRVGEPVYTESFVARPASKPNPQDEAPPIDPTAIPRAYERERARRLMRRERKRERRLAHLRFYVTMLLLLAAIAIIVALAWKQMHDLFGV